MNDGLVDAFRHNAWATRRLLEFCLDLSDDQLKATSTGAYGSILETLKHILGAEAYYRFMFIGHLPQWDWWDEAPTIVEMERSAADMARFWEDLLLAPLDGETTLTRQHEDGGMREAKAGIVLAQVLHHANVHREQVCAILTSLSIEPPDLDVWTYGVAAGRHRLERKT